MEPIWMNYIVHDSRFLFLKYWEVFGLQFKPFQWIMSLGFFVFFSRWKPIVWHHFACVTSGRSVAALVMVAALLLKKWMYEIQMKQTKHMKYETKEQNLLKFTYGKNMELSEIWKTIFPGEICMLFMLSDCCVQLDFAIYWGSFCHLFFICVFSWTLLFFMLLFMFFLGWMFVFIFLAGLFNLYLGFWRSRFHFQFNVLKHVHVFFSHFCPSMFMVSNMFIVHIVSWMFVSVHCVIFRVSRCAVLVVSRLCLELHSNFFFCKKYRIIVPRHVAEEHIKHC